ncbi:hypothetical protein C0993_008001 [Termitomyces sp. T159_Od127]|nr:hypothetical protein C0993_008001 [Termitomyces sp. T159_Od127]
MTGRDMLAYGFKPGEPWADDRRALEQAFREVDAQDHRSYSTYGNLGGRTTSSDLDGGSTLNTMNPINSRQSSAAYLYSDARDVDSDYYGEAPSVRLDQSSVASRVASDNGFRGGTTYPRYQEGQYLYPRRHSEYHEDVRVSPIRRDQARSSWEDELYESRDDAHARRDMDSDWEDGHQGYGSGYPGMFDHDQGRWFGSSEYDDYYEYDVESEDDYYYYGSESDAFENESHYGSDDFVGSSGGEESYVSGSEVGSDGSYEVYYYDSD